EAGVVRRVVAAVVYLHLAAATLHGAAHAALGIDVSGPWDRVFLLATVWLGPPAALRLLGRGRPAGGAALLAASMGGALVYGIVYHYVLPTPDHVARTPPGLWGAAFRASALAIALLEGVGALIGARLLASSRRRVPR
ncbi:MAG TPA: hypothetical protein VNK43_11545, partial [Gemmatimonadales bacterium]|nr:hypothetical protein [Gemmatimonadales bacterium]